MKKMNPRKALAPLSLLLLSLSLLSCGKKGRNPRQKCITCIAGGASRLGTAHGESSFLMKFSGGTLRRGDATGEL